MKKSLYLALFLAVVSILSALILSLTNELTKGPIREGQIAAQKENLGAMFPNATGFETMAISGNTVHIQEVIKVTENDQVVAYAFNVVSTGYGGDINFVIGINVKGEFVGFNPISHSETPGFGARLEEAAFRDQFTNLSIEGSIDGISGATRTTNALFGGIDEVVTYFEANLK